MRATRLCAARACSLQVSEAEMACRRRNGDRKTRLSWSYPRRLEVMCPTSAVAATSTSFVDSGVYSSNRAMVLRLSPLRPFGWLAIILGLLAASYVSRLHRYPRVRLGRLQPNRLGKATRPHCARITRATISPQTDQAATRLPTRAIGAPDGRDGVGSERVGSERGELEGRRGSRLPARPLYRSCDTLHDVAAQHRTRRCLAPRSSRQSPRAARHLLTLDITFARAHRL